MDGLYLTASPAQVDRPEPRSTRRDLVGDLAAGLGQVGPAAAAAADDGRHLLEPVARVQAALDQVFARARRRAGPCRRPR